MFCQEKKEEVAEEKETREEKKGKEEKKDGKKVGLRDTFHAQINLSIFLNYRTSVHCESPRKKNHATSLNICNQEYFSQDLLIHHYILWSEV